MSGNMRYHGTALLTILLWGTTFVSTKVLLVSISPLWILLLRFVLGFLVLWALSPHIMRLNQRSHEWLFVLAGLLGVAGYYLLENMALVYTNATNVGVIAAASPLFTAIFAALGGNKSALRLRFILGFAVAMCGLLLVRFGSGQGFSLAGDTSLIGDVLALIASLVWACYSLLTQHIAKLGYSTIPSTRRTFMWGLLFIVPATLLFGGELPAASVLMQVENFANLIYLGVFASAVCFVTWGLSVKHLGATTTTTYIYLVPAITATASMIILGEPFTPLIVLGIVLTISGLLLSQSRETETPTETSPETSDEVTAKAPEAAR